jgi:hypothetical protein
MLSQEQLADALSIDRVTLADLVDQTITIYGFELDSGQFGEFARIDASFGSEEHIEITSGGAVVLPQLKRLQELDAFPVSLRVVSFPGQFGKDGYKFETP